MKQLTILIIFSFSLLFAQEQTTKVIKKGDTFKADQDYRLMTTTDLLNINQKLIDLKTFQAKEPEYKNIIKNDSLQLQLEQQNKNMYKEMFDSYRKLWVESQDELAKKSYTKWYDSKLLWFTFGVATVFVSSEVVANIK